MTAQKVRESNAELIPPVSDEDLLNRINENANIFIKGEAGVLTWNTTKEQVIIDIANDMALLMDHKHPKYLGKDKSDISSEVCSLLKEKQFVDDDSFRWVRKVLAPLKYTNSKYANLELHEQKKKLFSFISKEELANMSLDQLLRYRKQTLSIDTERKRQIKLTKDNLDEEFEKREIDPDTYSPKSNKYDPAYEEDYQGGAVEPPAELKQYHKFSDKLLEGADFIMRLYKIFMGIHEKSQLFPPQNAELDTRLAAMQDVTNKKIFFELVKCYSGFNDDKAVATMDEWFDYLYEKSLHGNNAAASKFETPTGEYEEVVRKDGSKYLKALGRRVTNEHLKKKMPEQVKEIKNMAVFNEIFGALRTWNHEQYYVTGGSEIENAEIEREYITNKKPRD